MCPPLTFSGRKLTWLWHLHKGDIKTSYLAQKYIFNCNAWQLAILWQYNDVTSHTFNEIESNTAINKDTLKAQMQLLVKAKVLLQEGETYDLNLSELTDASCVRQKLMPDFKSKKLRVTLNQAVKAEQKAETVEVLQAVDEDRKFVYQATIVRLMKARKVSGRTGTEKDELTARR